MQYNSEYSLINMKINTIKFQRNFKHLFAKKEGKRQENCDKEARRRLDFE